MQSMPIKHFSNEALFFFKDNADFFLTPQDKKIAVLAAIVLAAITILCLVIEYRTPDLELTRAYQTERAKLIDEINLKNSRIHKSKVT